MACCCRVPALPFPATPGFLSALSASSIESGAALPLPVDGILGFAGSMTVFGKSFMGSQADAGEFVLAVPGTYLVQLTLPLLNTTGVRTSITVAVGPPPLFTFFLVGGTTVDAGPNAVKALAFATLVSAAAPAPLQIYVGQTSQSLAIPAGSVATLSLQHLSTQLLDQPPSAIPYGPRLPCVPVPSGALAAFVTTTDQVSLQDTKPGFNALPFAGTDRPDQGFGGAVIRNSLTTFTLAKPGTYLVSYCLPLLNVSTSAAVAQAQVALQLGAGTPTVPQTSVTMPWYAAPDEQIDTLTATTTVSVAEPQTVALFTAVAGDTGAAIDVYSGTLVLVLLSALQES